MRISNYKIHHFMKIKSTSLLSESLTAANITNYLTFAGKENWKNFCVHNVTMSAFYSRFCNVRIQTLCLAGWVYHIRWKYGFFSNFPFLLHNYRKWVEKIKQLFSNLRSKFWLKISSLRSDQNPELLIKKLCTSIMEFTSCH